MPAGITKVRAVFNAPRAATSGDSVLTGAETTGWLLLTGPATPDPPPLLAAMPTKTFASRRFIALHMTCVRIDPEAATVAPQAISNRFSMMIPQNAAARPAVAFRKEINTGISAPPIRIANTHPNPSENKAIVPNRAMAAQRWST